MCFAVLPQISSKEKKKKTSLYYKIEFCHLYVQVINSKLNEVSKYFLFVLTFEKHVSKELIFNVLVTCEHKIRPDLDDRAQN